MCRVLLFGRLQDVAGWRVRQIDPSPASLADLRAKLTGDDKALAEALAQPGVRVAVDRTVVQGDAAGLTAASEVAFMPPMSGG
jgi:molybdopterin synthase sulfur carrier subunit